jgi:hypothetical protein
MSTVINWPLLREAIAIIDGIPDEHFDLSTYGDRFTNLASVKACGSIGCAVGWLWVHPDFPKRAHALGGYGQEDHNAWAMQVFGISHKDARALFSIGNFYESDFQHEPGLSDADLFRARVRAFFAEHRQPINPLY